MSKINMQQVDELAEKIKAGLEVKDDKIHGTAELYYSTLPEGLTQETVQALQEHNGAFFPAFTKASGQLAHKHLKGSKDLAEVEAQGSIGGRDYVQVTHSRSKDHMSPQDKSTKTTYGYTDVKVVIQSARGKVGIMKEVRQELHDAALKALGGGK